ncbi:MAG: DUF3565 domain-containing protein [Candidatus Binatia bacterium]
MRLDFTLADIAGARFGEPDGASGEVAVQRRITGFHQDDEDHWVAQLDCGHNQHVRHNPPFNERPWTQTEPGRSGMLGQSLDCLKCERGEPSDSRPPRSRQEPR